jgi:hypothetical protein
LKNWSAMGSSRVMCGASSRREVRALGHMVGLYGLRRRGE